MQPVRPADDPAVLLEQWHIDVAVLVPDAGAARHEAEGALLVRGWTEPHRRYHTLTHLAEMFAALADLESAGAVDGEGARRARVAAWYHDLSYDPRAATGRNEHRSAAVARDQLHRLGADAATVDTVEALILLTADHQGAGPADGGASQTAAVRAAFHDADLWILAAPADRFDEYCHQVRAEFAHVPTALYAEGRAAILGSLIGRGPVYRTAHGHRHWEVPARANVARELARLARLAR